jgi:glycosyltransferase involved in cell wall biosynthesis
MNILYHHRTQGRGVEGVHIREIIKAWKREKHNVDIVEPPKVSAMDEDDHSNNKKRGLTKTLYKYISRYVPEFVFEIAEISYNSTATNRLRKLLKKKHYSFLYERYALFNWSGVREAKRAGIPVVLEVNYTSHTPLYRKRSRILKPFASWIEKWVFTRADEIVVISTYLKQHLLELGIDEGKIIILTNAADPEKFSPEEKDNDVRDQYRINGKTVIGFAGGFYPWHGLELLINAYKLVSKKYKDVVLFLIGDGPMMLQLKSKAANSGLKDNVVFAGTINHRKLPEYISVFDVAVMPHSNEYGSPMKIYEYMAMSKPVIAPRFGPLEDGITHGSEGLLFKPENTEELIVSLERLIEDRSLREEMGRSGREKILSKHNWRNNALSVIRSCECLIAGTKEPDACCASNI